MNKFIQNKVSTPIIIRNEKHVSREVIRALKFMEVQIKKGWTYEEVFQQIENAYGERIHFYVLLSIQQRL